MYKCVNCGFVFGTPETRCEDYGFDTEIGHVCVPKETDICPRCGSDEIDNAEECCVCGAYDFEDSMYLGDDLNYYCKYCEEELDDGEL